MSPTIPRIRMAMPLAALLAAPPAGAELHRFVLAGQVSSTAGTRAASLRFLCEPDPHGGAISLELWVPEAATRKDFDYEDFEGPDAPAGDRALSHVTVTGGGVMLATSVAAGWYSGEDPDTFVFGLSQPSHQTGTVATLLEAVDPRDTRLEWVQTGFADSKRQLRATFTLDFAAVKQIRDAVDPCLPPAAKPSPADTREAPRRGSKT
jgi:hypothetical protein